MCRLCLTLQRVTTERTPSERLLLLKEFESRKYVCVCVYEHMSVHV